MKTTYKIKAIVTFEKNQWPVVFERVNSKELTAAKTILKKKLIYF